MAAAATEPIPGRVNQDWCCVTPSAAVVLDGVTPRGETGCVHDVPWYVSRLGAALVSRLGAALPLADTLAGAIADTARAHEGACDLSQPGSPAAAVAVLRWHGDVVEYLALADVTVVLHGADGLQVITDDRVAATEPVPAGAVGTAGHTAGVEAMMYAQLTSRNRPGGYWVASSSPAAAAEAITGTASGSTTAAALTDGAAAVVDRYGLMTWTRALAVLTERGPAELIRRARTAERADPDGTLWPRLKTADDATAVIMTRD